MPCYHPIEVGVPKPSPHNPERKHWVGMTVPCGNCLGCRAKQARDWAFRILHETQMHQSSWFLTLTYSDDQIPENGSLHPPDLQKFFKALRKDQPPKTISYFACGEYGEQTQRPHYHAVLYGLDFLDKRPHNARPDRPNWRSKTLESYWPHGLSEFSTVTSGSASYVAGYVRKKISRRVNSDAYTRVIPETGELVELHQEFSRMSLRPAIGKRWIQKYWTDVYPRDFVVMNGREFKPPRYYDKFMEENHPKIMADVKAKRDQDAIVLEQEKLDSKRKIHTARTELFSKRNRI